MREKESRSRISRFETLRGLKADSLPLEVKSGVLYTTDQSMGSGLLTVTPSWRRILHISSISATAFFKWSAGKAWPPLFW